MSGSPCRTASRARWPANWSPACRRTTRSWRPTAARPPACWPNAPAWRPKASAARAPTGTRCGRWTCRPPRSRPRCSRWCPSSDAGRLLDIGTGTGRVLELLAPRISQGVGVDASKAMLALARSRLARAGLTHCSVRLADMYRLPLAEASFDVAVMQMVLHYAEDPPGVLAEVARVLRPGGRLIVIDLAQHDRDDLLTRLAHRWPGFSDAAMRDLLDDAGMQQGAAAYHRRSARHSPVAGHPRRRCPDRAAARTGRLNAPATLDDASSGACRRPNCTCTWKAASSRTVAGAGGAQWPAAALGYAGGAARRLSIRQSASRSSISTTRAAASWCRSATSTTSPAPICAAPMPMPWCGPRSSLDRKASSNAACRSPR